MKCYLALPDKWQDDGGLTFLARGPVSSPVRTSSHMISSNICLTLNNFDAVFSVSKIVSGMLIEGNM